MRLGIVPPSPLGQGSFGSAMPPAWRSRLPDTREVLGYEAIYLGQAKVIKFEERLDTASPIEITKSALEVHRVGELGGYWGSIKLSLHNQLDERQ